MTTMYYQIEADSYDLNAYVTGTGTKVLDVGLNTLYINVTAESGEVRTYTLNVTRENLPEGEHTAELQRIEIENANTIEVVSGVLEYNVDFEANQMSAEINAIPYDSSASISITGNTLMLEKSGVITIVVTQAESNPSVLTYTINYTVDGVRNYNSYDFDYTGDIQSFTSEEGATYLVEAWGAQGGNVNVSYYSDYATDYKNKVG
jgi:hypothetical protein